MGGDGGAMYQLREISLPAASVSEFDTPIFHHD
jgi:hypothetical protein